MWGDISPRADKNKKEGGVKKEMNKLKVLSSALLVASVILASFIVGYKFGSDSGKVSVANHIRHNVSVVNNLSSPEVQSQLQEYFPEKLNYTELFVWQSTRMEYTQDRDIHTDPLEILEYQKGACGEFSIVYVACCLANDIPARLLVTGYVITGSVDHTWAEVNPSKDGETWIHVEPTDCAYNILHGASVDELTCYDNPSMHYDKNYELVLAFEPTQDGEIIIRDRTETYSPNP